MTTHDEEPSDADESDQPFLNPRVASLRNADEAGVFYDDAYKPGEVGAKAGIIAGDRRDPVLVCGIGYPLLSDLAFGTVVAYRIADLDIPGVAVCDASHTPIAAYQTLTEGEYQTAIMVGAEKRGDNEFNDGNPSENPGKVHEFTPEDYEVPDDEELIERVGESAMGSNTVKNVLVISKAFSGLPENTHVLTAEVGYDSWGMNVAEFTDPVEVALDDVLDKIIDIIDETVDHDVRAELDDDPLDRELDEDVLEDLRDDSAGQVDDPMEDEWVKDEAIARLDDEARDMLEELDDDVATEAAEYE